MDGKKIKIYTGQSSLLLNLTEKEFSKFQTDLQSKQKPWIVLEDVNGNVFQIRNEQVSAFEVIHQKKRKTADGTIPIKTLADFAGIHPVRITRNLSHTLAITKGKQREFSRATKQTAIELYEMLSEKGETKKKKSDFLNLFE